MPKKTTAADLGTFPSPACGGGQGGGSLGGKVLPDDRLAERDVANRILGRRARLSILGDTRVKLQQLALERRLERDRLDGPPGARALLASTLQHQLDRRAAQEGRGKDQSGSPLRVKERELLL